VKQKIAQFITDAIALILILLFLVKFGTAPLLRAYVQLGVGSCRKIPIFCLSPDNEIINPEIDEDFKSRLIPYKFPKLRVSLPKGFNVVQEEKKEFYYTRDVRKYAGPAIYLVYQKPGFFLGLFPQLTKQGITDNYTFVSRTMAIRTPNIRNLTDTFFAIMKGIFTPNLGDQRNIRMAGFSMPGYRGFITYNLQGSENYFACDIIDREDGFFKIYIKDKAGALDLTKVFTIISTAKKQD
jgi:hypothetical protein